MAGPWQKFKTLHSSVDALLMIISLDVQQGK
jgi:hypothetical protein